MKKKIIKFVMLCLCSFLFIACGKAEEKRTPTVTQKPKVMIIDAATPTPTLTLEEGELPKEPEPPVLTETPVPEPVETITPEPTVTVTPQETAIPTPTATPKPTKIPTATPQPTKVEKRPYEKGILTDTEFQSEWMGMKFTAKEGIELSPQEELDETMRLMEEAVSGKEIKGALNYESLALVYEMALVWQDKGLNMQVMVERVEGNVATTEDYVAAMREEMSLLEENGFTYIVDDKTYPKTIAGKEFLNFGYTTYYGDDISLHQENYIRKQDDRIILISIMGESEEGMQELLDAFFPY